MVQRLRVRYAKRGRLRFTSHRDFARAFERALRRADVPIGYSAGFSPHPKVSYVGAAPTGVASEAEYLEIGLAERREPAAVRAALDAALPPGLDVVEVVEARAPGSLADRVDASQWQLVVPDVDAAAVRAALDELLAASAAPVERLMKDGRRTIDARAPLVAAEVCDAPPQPAATGGSGHCAILRLVVRHATPAVRPDDVLTALRQVASFVPPVPPVVTRLAQGLLDDAGRLADPLAPDRAAADPADTPPPSAPAAVTVGDAGPVQAAPGAVAAPPR